RRRRFLHAVSRRRKSRARHEHEAFLFHLLRLFSSICSRNLQLCALYFLYFFLPLLIFIHFSTRLFIFICKPRPKNLLVWLARISIEIEVKKECSF
uniref:Uncharacterized protein n=1 Tax=Oryza brachyantha TaxID=4533 RepID=J3MIA1_ORYBR